MTLKELEYKTDQISEVLAQQIDRDNPDELTGRLMELSALQATATTTMAFAEMLYNQKIADLVQASEYSKLSATDKKMIFAGKAKQEIFFLTLSERQTKNISYAIEALRSVLSFLKSEALNSKYQTT